jgi:hypothetical protein
MWSRTVSHVCLLFSQQDFVCSKFFDEYNDNSYRINIPYLHLMDDVAWMDRFVTGSARGPIRGFGTLNPKFGIKRYTWLLMFLSAADNYVITLLGCSYGDDPSRLPLASTCFNQLHLPPYQTLVNTQMYKLSFFIFHLEI